MMTTVICLISAIILVFISTIAQIETDIHTVERTMLRSYFVWWNGFPVFPGGITIALVLLLNLGVSLAKHGFWKNKALLFVHLGFALLIVGEGLRMITAEESFLVLNKGETVYYTESATDFEVAIIDHSPKEYDLVKSVTIDNLLQQPVTINEPLPIAIEHNRYTVDGYGSWPLTEGARKFGDCEVCIRPKRTYYPYGITLNEFHYEIHPGSDIPKSFASNVSIVDNESQSFRDVEIAMNSPLNYKGKTYYQENYANNGKTSVLHVVENRWKSLPYISITIIAFGLTFNLFKILSRGR